MGMIDLVVIATIIISVLFALYRGLLRELLGITSWILAGVASAFSYLPAIKLLTDKVDNVKVWAISSSGLIALTILIIMTIVNARIAHSLRKSSLSGLDRILGIMFGVLRAVLLIVLVWLFASQMAWTPKQLEVMKEQNFSVKYIQMAADWAEEFLPDGVRKDMKRPTPQQRPKTTQPVKPSKPAVEYKDIDRESLDKMIETIVEIEEIK